MARFVEAQGGDPSYVLDEKKLKIAANVMPLTSKEDGVVSAIACAEVGMASLALGGGRETKAGTIDPEGGILLHKKVGDVVCKGDVLAEIYYNDDRKGEEGLKRLEAAYRIGEEAPEKRPIILGEVKG